MDELVNKRAVKYKEKIDDAKLKKRKKTVGKNCIRYVDWKRCNNVPK